jgi:hypothetical protein
MPKNNPETNSAQILDDLKRRIDQGGENQEQDAPEIQLLKMARRLENALKKHQEKVQGESSVFEVPMSLGFRRIQADFVKEVTFGFAGRRRIVAIYRDRQWELEYWYTSEQEPNGRAKAKTAEAALRALLPVFVKTRAFGFKNTR